MNLINKKSFFVLCISFLGFFTALNVFSQATSTLLGDVNNDNRVNVNDALLTAQQSAGLNPASFLLPQNADVNADGKIDILDGLLIARYSAGLITVFPGATPTPTPTSTMNSYIYQAELGNLYDYAILETINTGYTGTGYVNFHNQAGGYIDLPVNIATAGSKTCTFRFANASGGDRPLEVRVNGTVAVANLTFNTTASWTTWQEQEINLSFQTGVNTIRLTSLVAEGGPNLDFIEIAGGLPPVSTPTPTATLTPTPTPTITSIPQTGYQMEKLDRGIVAMKVSNGVFISWRVPGPEFANVAYNIYRGTTKLNSSPITGATNYTDTAGTTGSAYSVSAVVNGVEQAASPAVSTWSTNYLQIPIQAPNSTYSANDCSVGDLDGDGQYEIVLKWDPANAQDNANAGVTDVVYLDAYKLSGTRLWRINLGRNIRAGAHYTQFMVYDLDGDGKAEVACKTADGTVDGVGTVIGSSTADYRNASGYILTGPEYLTIFNGQNGAILKTVNYEPARGTVSSWGDDYGNRVDRFLACVAYLDGKRPSLVMCRGYYTRAVLVAWDWRNGSLTRRWTFDTNNGYSAYTGQGNHNLSVGDVDGDGRDEIVYGGCTIDDNGQGLYSTGNGHGDAMHLSDLDPDRAGLEVWRCLEGGTGATLSDARNGAQVFRYTHSKDCGRCCAGDILASSRGAEMWAAGSPLYSCKGTNLGTAPGQMNFMIWWDGDELREILDGITISKWGGSTLLSDSGCAANNGTKNTPCLSADILGDWREELILRTSDNAFLRVYSTTATTSRKLFTLMHDPIYRLGVAWQNVAYNLPPHTGFFIGDGMAVPAAPKIYLVP